MRKLDGVVQHAELQGMHTFVFNHADDFPEMRDFIADTDARYRLGIEYLEGDFKAGLEQLLQRRPIKAIFLGTRRCVCGNGGGGGSGSRFCRSSLAVNAT
jgi:hypothetical protein